MKSSTSDTHWITLPDGTRLAATLWMPDGDGPFPAVLEYLPYRRRDGTAVRDDATYPGFAAAGIAGVRVDSRGQGDSEGTFDDEYSPTELQDCCDVIAWIASQQWSNGAVGMMGISWGGFNGLQVAALRPPALKAVISIASTSDRYGDDIHYKGGSLLSANVSWATTMLSYTSRPPDPMVVGNRWADIWRDRLENMPFLLETWLQHPHRDAYWRHGSICEDWDAIECPVWVIAGWADGYRNTPAAIARHLGAPVKAMTGPWVHKYPHFAWPRPRADFIGMATRWWRQWLCDEDHAVEGWADHMIYKIEAARPADWRSDDPGCWVGQPRRATVETLKLTLGSDGILPGDLRQPVTIETPQHCGTTAGEYFTLAPDADMPGDQGPDDALSACWQTAANADPIDISGRPTLNLRVAIDRVQGNLIARLCDVHPDGTSTLISRGVLNLCHRTGHETPAPVIPGEEMDVSIALDETAYRVRPGHCLRLAISTAYWPLVVPSPAPVTAALASGTLTLPSVPNSERIDVPAPADPSPLPEYPEIAPGARKRWTETDPDSGRIRYNLLEDTGHHRHPRHAMEVRETREESWEIDPEDPDGATGSLTMTTLRQRDTWRAQTVAKVHFTAQADRYLVDATLEASTDDVAFAARRWSFSVARKMV